MSRFYKIAKKCINKAESLPPRIAGKIDASIAFVHIPKCGGTSLHTAISRHYRTDHINYLDPTASRNVSQADDVAMLPFRRSLLAYQLAKSDGNRFISGHWPVDQALLHTYAPNWSFVTVLRDPVARWLSNYFFNRHRADNRDHFGTELDLEAYLDTRDAVENGKLYLSFCHGGHMPEGDLSATISEAIDVLAAFDLIGTLDDMEGFLDRFEQHWQVRPSIPLTNVSPANRHMREKALTPSILQRIEDICAPDQKIYDAVRARQSST